MRVIFSLYILCLFMACGHEGRVVLEDNFIRLAWQQDSGIWRLNELKMNHHGKQMAWKVGKLGYVVLYEATKPAKKGSVLLTPHGDTIPFLEEKFSCIRNSYAKSIAPVALNRAGQEVVFNPSEMWKAGDKVCFQAENPFGVLRTEWSADPDYPGDIRVKMVLKAAKEGYFSMMTPSVAVLEEDALKWGVVPGFFQGDAVQPNFPLAYVYGQGLPDWPVLCRESTVTTMTSVMTDSCGITLAVTPRPGYDRNAYEKDTCTHSALWKTALSHKNRSAQLCPTAWHPVLGESGSLLAKGDSVSFEFNYTFRESGWYGVYQHVVYNIYKFRESLRLKKSSFSLTDRMFAIHDYVTDDELSLWRTEVCKGVKIGAQSYLGGVVESDRDAMKNSDVGAAWMLARMTGDSLLSRDRLPFMRNFKLMQQSGGEGGLAGVAQGQYYLYKKKKFVEEWGDHVEPIGITYYTLIDIGNILLFQPDDDELRACLRKGADRLLALQKENGSFEVAYDKETGEPIYTDLQDLRPTFYGFVVAYDLLKDPKYLEAARRGADWFVDNAVAHGHFLGVCGDARFINDFATGQSAQALLEMYRLTRDEKYKVAAIRTAEMYTCSIYTHACATDEVKMKRGTAWKDWQLSQVGLSFEHGGSAGSAVPSGPILLSSHCGMFVRLFGITGDSLFLDMARAGAIAREAFLNPETKIATYYWSQFDRGPGPFPHHAWWQLGWIADYLMAEAELRSSGKICFPRGFVTPKVGPQQVYGFRPGEIYGVEADMILRKGLVGHENPDIDVLTGLSVDHKSLFVILLNSSAHHQQTVLKIKPEVLGWQQSDALATDMTTGEVAKPVDGEYRLSLEEWGIKVLKLSQ